MKLIKSEKASLNYLSHVINITEFEPHPNAERMKIARVGGYGVCVGIDEQPGKFIYFPVNSEINPELLSYCNLYRHSNLNSDETKTGFFGDNGRVTAIKLRGFPSEGFLLPYVQLENFIQDNLNLTLEDTLSGIDFDSAREKDKIIWISKKYIIVRRNSGSYSSHDSKQKNVKRFNRIIDDQFHFHYDTCQVKKEPWCIEPRDLISITEKIHGTSGISAYVLCKKEQTIWNRIKKFIGIPDTYYDYLYSSRTVIKNAFETTNPGEYYGCDIWAEADKIIRPHLRKGMTVYYEIVGFLPTGAYIQKNYDYGCVPPEEGEMFTHEKHFKVRVYRVTMTNVEGYTHEFSAREVQQWCRTVGLTPVRELYYGMAKDLYSIIHVNEDDILETVDEKEWQKTFWNCMANDKKFAMEQKSPSCNNDVPHEGLVIKKEDGIAHAWKLKCFAFLNGEQKELDSGEANIEDNA